MSERDYKAGLQGREWSPEMDRTDFEAGQSVRKSKENILSGSSGPKTSFEGASLGMLFLIPVMPFVYPLLGALAIGIAYSPGEYPESDESQRFPGLPSRFWQSDPGFLHVPEIGIQDRGTL
jgi:hypothetical protein